MINPTEDDLGRRVRHIHRGTAVVREGRVTAFNDMYVWVQYDLEPVAKATLPQNLEWASVRPPFLP